MCRDIAFAVEAHHRSPLLAASRGRDSSDTVRTSTPQLYLAFSIIDKFSTVVSGAVGVVVSHPLSMREAPGSIPRLSMLNLVLFAAAGTSSHHDSHVHASFASPMLSNVTLGMYTIEEKIEDIEEKIEDANHIHYIYTIEYAL